MKTLYRAYQCAITGMVFEEEIDALRCEVSAAAHALANATQDEIIHAVTMGGDDSHLLKCVVTLKESSAVLRYRFADELAAALVTTSTGPAEMTIGANPGQGHAAGAVDFSPAIEVPDPLPEDRQF